jgi:hypothetical protein
MAAVFRAICPGTCRHRLDCSKLGWFIRNEETTMQNQKPGQGGRESERDDDDKRGGGEGSQQKPGQKPGEGGQDRPGQGQPGQGGQR